MKLFRHYKDKPYKFIGTAIHSETLEEVVVYETRYDNSLAKLWVRPKKMFYENITVDGNSIPRFKEVTLEIKESIEITENDIQLIAPLIEAIFGKWDPEWFYSTFNNRTKFYLLIGFIDGKAVGFKIGYEQSQSEFYSWLGGVHPDFQGLSIASDLMKRQHEWCVTQGYKKISTKTKNRFRSMLLLNINKGFEIIGSHLSPEGDIDISLVKQL